MMMQKLQSHPILMKSLLVFSLLIFSVYMLLTPITQARAAAAVVPVVGAVAAVGLLLAMGVINPIYQAPSGSIVPKYGISEEFGYLGDVIVGAFPGIQLVTGITGDQVGSIFERLFPQDLYWTDGDTYYVDTYDGLRPVTSGDVYVSSPFVAEASYTLPVNIVGLMNTYISYNGSSKYYTANTGTLFTSATTQFAVPVGKFRDDYGGTYWASKTGALTYTGLQSYGLIKNWQLPNADVSTLESVPFGNSWLGGTVYFMNIGVGFGTWFQGENIRWVSDSMGTYCQLLQPFLINNYSNNWSGDWVYDGRTFSPSVDSYIEGTFAVTEGIPVVSLDKQYPQLKDKPKELEDTWVNVKPSGEGGGNDDDEDGKKHPFPVSPDFWDIFKTILDIINNKPDKPSNNKTTLGDYISNGFIYNNQVVEAPEIPDTFYIYGDLNMHVDADVNLSGDLNITINENYNPTLPEVTASDGDGVFDMNAATVVGALTTNNPVFPTISTLMQSIDPTLRALFVTGVGFLMLLGLWHLIRR